MPRTTKHAAFSLSALRRRSQDAAQTLPSLMADAERAAQSVLTGDHRQRKPGAGEKFWQFREYQPTDRPQDIDWRQSAKGDRVFIRQKEWQTTQTALFWRAGGPGMDYRSAPSLPAKAEEACVLSLALGLLMTRAGEQVAPAQDGARPGRSDSSIERLARGLLDAADAPVLPPAALRVPRHANLVLAGDFLSPPEEIESAFRALAARADSAIVLQILDPAEIDFPFAGRVIFEEADGGARHHVAQAESVAAAYRERLRAHIESVQTICRRLQWNWILHPAGTDPAETLRAVWAAINAGKGAWDSAPAATSSVTTDQEKCPGQNGTRDRAEGKTDGKGVKNKDTRNKTTKGKSAANKAKDKAADKIHTDKTGQTDKAAQTATTGATTKDAPPGNGEAS